MDFGHHQFAWGLILGCVLGLIVILFVLLRLWEASREIGRLKRHLSEKLELESEATGRLRQDLLDLRQQNENLRVKIANLNQTPDRRLRRELEIFARAERWMVTSSPGFPAVWEEAKRSAVEDVQNEENGRSLPTRVFQALLNRPAKSSNPDHPE
jgi:hypothetical protein